MYMENGMLKEIRKKKPIVHCITNAVTVNDCANALLAIGASPTMAHHIEEVEEITAGCDALICNFGATDDYDAMFLAVKKSNTCKHPVVVDPVGIAGSTFRRKKLLELLEIAHVDCIRGNYSEIYALINNEKRQCGVDASKDDQLHPDQLLTQMKRYSSEHHVILIASGKIDLVTDGHKSYGISGGDEMMARITGTGCMSSALLGAVLSVDHTVVSASWLCKFMKKTGEIAVDKTEKVHGGTMTFREKLIDQISLSL